METIDSDYDKAFSSTGKRPFVIKSRETHVFRHVGKKGCGGVVIDIRIARAMGLVIGLSRCEQVLEGNRVILTFTKPKGDFEP